jgi:hypothetical protein
MVRRIVIGVVLAAVSFASISPVCAQALEPAPLPPPRPILKPPPPMQLEKGPSGLMQSLYGTTILAQGLDWDSTMTALSAGAIEKNPLIRPFTSHRSAFAALKLGIAASAIVAAHNLSKHHKVRAVIALVAIDLFYGSLAVRNYKIARDMRLAGGR